MAQMNSGGGSGIARLILVPSVITLMVTILRLIGELQHWSSVWFNPGAGGGGAIMGITWLVPIFGVYFALKLSGPGERPERVGRAIMLAVLGFLVMVGGTFITFAPPIQFPGKVVAGFLLMAAAAALQLPAWPALFKTLLAYGYAARIPVALVMFFAIQGHWGTHYDALPPGFSEMSFWATYVRIGLLPQLIFWVVFTVIVGSLFGSIATAIFARRMSVSPAH
ncbi:MAG: hypothetical protein DMG05_19235 [Acidobacteria bacterium]|nr:MAG: hypothetical protein DMG05_19235 [Acidobacteriota bacterium]